MVKLFNCHNGIDHLLDQTTIFEQHWTLMEYSQNMLIQRILLLTKASLLYNVFLITCAMPYLMICAVVPVASIATANFKMGDLFVNALQGNYLWIRIIDLVVASRITGKAVDQMTDLEMQKSCRNKGIQQCKLASGRL